MHFEQNWEGVVHLSFIQGQPGQLKGWAWNHLKIYTLKFGVVDAAAAWGLQVRFW